MANLSIAALAARAGLAEGTVKRAEAADGHAPITAANARLLVQTLVIEGITFLEADELGAGVRMFVIELSK